MPDWLQEAVQSSHEISIYALFLRLVLAFLLGVMVAAIYRYSLREPDKAPQSFVTTLVLMTIVIAMSTQVIGDNVARAFSLVGALSIVRFRTVVQDTRDTVFVIFSVVVGMAIGASHLAVALVGIVITGVASFLLRPRNNIAETSGADLILVLRYGLGWEPEFAIKEVLAKYLATYDLRSTSSTKQGNAIEYSYLVKLQDGITQTELVSALNLSDGIERVSLQKNKV